MRTATFTVGLVALVFANGIALAQGPRPAGPSPKMMETSFGYDLALNDRGDRERRLSYEIAPAPTSGRARYWVSSRPMPAVPNEIDVGDVVRDEHGRYLGEVVSLDADTATVRFSGPRTATMPINSFWKTPSELIVPTTRRGFERWAAAQR